MPRVLWGLTRRRHCRITEIFDQSHDKHFERLGKNVRPFDGRTLTRDIDFGLGILKATVGFGTLARLTA